MKRILLGLLISSALVLIPVMHLGAQDQQQEQGPPSDQGQYPEPGAPQQNAPQQSQDQSTPQQPQSAVGRISIIDGNLSTQRSDSGSWVADTINTPVVPGDQLSTGPHSRAEIELDYANVLRLDHDAQVRVADLTQQHVQVQVAQGQVDFDVIRDGGAAPEIDTPNVAVHPAGHGAYRVDVNSPTETLVTVRDGSAQVSTPQGSTTVQKGQTITIHGSDNPEYKVDEALARDDWDHWNAERDKTILSAKSWENTNPYYTGSADLDNNGQWENAPGYGQVWVPQQGPGWAPYSNGTWVWEPDWGWTWVSYEPWGWAPYHYGRWFYYNSAWCWWPGPVGFGWGFSNWYRPIWAPAYVSFFGFGWGHFGFGFGFGVGGGWGWGHVGWLPCGPRDPYYPTWGRGGRFNAVNVTNVANIHNYGNGVMRPLAGAYAPAYGSNLQRAFTDAGVRHGITTVTGNRFGQGPVRGETGAVTADMLRNGSVMSGHMPFAPTRASLSAINRPAAASTIARGSMSEHFAGTRAPEFNHASFAQESSAIREASRNINPSTMNRAAASNESRGFGSFSQTASSRSITAENFRQSAPQSSQATEGWKRFASQGGERGGEAGKATSGARAGSQESNARPRSGPENGSNSARGSWQRFSSQPAAPRSSSPSPGRSEPNSGYRSAPSSRYYTGQARPSPGYYAGGARNYGYSRPPLQMSRPMFSPRSAPNYGGYGRPAPSGGGYRPPSGGYSAPHSYGGYGGSGHSGGFGGGHASGSGSHGGGGGGHHR
ncbi:MAG TPA: DUF6600 domain-containing protein [Terriglobia bacterium]|nr:DUF6600 domain-containing protein [Terriglobia bacterium]